MFGPDGGDMRVGEVGEAEVGPDGFGDIRDNVAGRIPGEENAEFSFALRIDSAVEEANAGVAAAGVRENERAIFWDRDVGLDIEAFDDGGDLVGGEAGGGADFFWSETVIGDHVFEPEFSVGIVFERAEIFSGLSGKKKTEKKSGFHG